MGIPWRRRCCCAAALEYAGMFGMPVIEHCEDQSLKGDGVAHEGFHAASLGPAWEFPAQRRRLGAERGILLSELTGSASTSRT
jgi:dihydroorotase